jgi:hypothetical protein
VSVIFIIFLILCGLHFNHLFIWLDPEVVAHDALIATKVGYLNFPFGLLEQYSLGGWNLYRYYSQKIVGLKMKLMTIVLQKRTLIYQLVFWFSL